MTPYSGNCPRSVSRDAKYAIRRDSKGSMQVTLLYRISRLEKVLVSTNDHPELVELVNAVKEEVSDVPGGSFYLNEYNQVLVPAGQGATYFLAGEYDRRLKFEFEGGELSGDALSLSGDRLAPGDTWEGPHPGIPYIRDVNNDICYETKPQPNHTIRILLSDVVGRERASEIANQIDVVKGSSGRFYVNEFAQMFTPVGGDQRVEYLYIGGLDLTAGWFPKVG